MSFHGFCDGILSTESMSLKPYQVTSHWYNGNIMRRSLNDGENHLVQELKPSYIFSRRKLQWCCKSNVVMFAELKAHLSNSAISPCRNPFYQHSDAWGQGQRSNNICRILVFVIFTNILCIHLEETITHEYNVFRRCDMAWQCEETSHKAIRLFSKTQHLGTQHCVRKFCIYTSM